MKVRLISVLIIIKTLLVLLPSCGKEGPEGSFETPPKGSDNPDDTPVNPNRPILIPTISELRWYPTSWQKAWSNDLLKYLDETYLPEMNLSQGDLARLGCPGYNQAKAQTRKTFWLVFMASISSQESAFNPKTRYWEDSLDEWSEGLFQLSLSDRKPKGGCSLINSRSILTPRPNIFCALDIMENQVLGSRRYQRPRGTLFPSRPYYWSVLTRPKAQAKVIEFFKRHLDELPFCNN
jgi:hypothetical protein